MMVIMTYMTFPTTGVLEVTVATAKARFAACVREAEQGTTVVITKHGRRVAALVPAGDVEELRRLRAAGPKAGLASLAGGWEGSDDLVKEIRRYKRTPPRGIPDLECSDGVPLRHGRRFRGAAAAARACLPRLAPARAPRTAARR